MVTTFGDSTPLHPTPLSLLVVLPLMLSVWPFLPANPHQKALITAAAPPTSTGPIINKADWPADHPVRHQRFACDSVYVCDCAYECVFILKRVHLIKLVWKSDKEKKKKSLETEVALKRQTEDDCDIANTSVHTPWCTHTFLPPGWMLWHQLTLLSCCSVKTPWLEYLPFNL